MGEPGQCEPFGNRSRLESADGKAGFGLLITEVWGAKLKAGEGQRKGETASRKAHPAPVPPASP